MERLTAREKGIAYYPHCFREDTCDGMGPDTTCEGCDFITQVCERLAAYEDLEPAPEQLRKVNNLYREKCEEVAKLKKQIEQMAAGWIDVTERLPEVETEVFILTNRGTITTAMYEDGTVLENDSCWRWEDIEGEWDEENDCYIIPEGWWEQKHFNSDGVLNNAVDEVVVKWRELPKE